MIEIFKKGKKQTQNKTSFAYLPEEQNATIILQKILRASKPFPNSKHDFFQILDFFDLLNTKASQASRLKTKSCNFLLSN